jgi:hypothetical protein
LYRCKYFDTNYNKLYLKYIDIGVLFMPYRISLTERGAAVSALTGLFNKGANPGPSTINIYSNATTQPATPETAIPGGSVLLSQIPFSGTAFLAQVNGTATASGLPLQAPVINSGVAEWFLFADGAASPNPLGNGTVSLTGSGGDMTFDNTTFVSGGIVSITNLSITVPM